MNRFAKHFITVAAFSVAGFFTLSAHGVTTVVTNISADPSIFLCDLTATNFNVTIVTTNGALLVTNTVHAEVYKDENNPSWPGGTGIPIPFMQLSTGQVVICRFKNKIPAGGCGCLDEGTSIHWHGIELDNDSDGTGVTQDSVLNGQSYTYIFRVTRPGLFWFHSHMMPGNTTFAGMYGAIVIPNGNESALITSNVLPNAANTFTLALSDIEFDAAGNVGRTNAALGVFKTINQWAEDCGASSSPSFTNVCQMPAKPGQVVLVNGQNPIDRIGARTPLFTVPKSKRIRLRLLNEAITRNFRLKLLDASGNQIKLYRIGGQGGLLDKFRLEGGTNGTWDTGYTKGEVNIGSGDRVEVIALTPTNAITGQILKLVGNPLDPPFVLSGDTLGGAPNIPSNYPIAFFQISPVVGGETEPTTNDVIEANSAEPVESIKTNSVDALTDPVPLSLIGTNAPVISLSQAASRPAVDGIRAGKLDGNLGNGDWLTIPFTNNTRYARIGDTIELSVDNTTTPAHPFHLHGFSMQPIRVVDTATTNTLFTYDYNEFVDTIDIYGGQTLVFRVRLDDREKMCDEAPSATLTNGPVLKPCSDSNCGGALGRWLYHCHIFAHAGLGMINEIVVLDSIENSNIVKVTKQPDLTPTGVDVLAKFGTGSQMVADDFLCTTSGPITKVSIWGSWLNDIVDFNPTFELKFWTDVPGSPSHPGVPLWREVFAPGTYTNSVAGYVFYEEFFDPTQPSTYYSDTQVWRYDFTIPECDAFHQSVGNIYWLSVTAYTTNGTLFGWKTCVTNDYFNDDATWSATTNFPTIWTDLHYPNLAGHPYTNSMDMAFELGTGVPTNCPPPVASFYGVPVSGQPPLLVNFTDTSTGSITNRYWDFGDGATTNLPFGNPSHSYTGGTYTVTLIVSGPCGDSTNELTDYIDVNCPVAGFSASPTNGPAPLLVNFTDSSTGTITNWHWDFGDGVTLDLPSGNTSHSYTAGLYTVSLLVSGPCGDDSKTNVNYIRAFTPYESWLSHYFPGGGPNSLPGADPDRDGMSNTNEFLSGFNPTNNSAYLKLISILKTNNDIRITYLGPNGDTTWVPGIVSRTNVLEFTKGMANGSFSNNFASTGRTNILSGGIGLGIQTNFLETGGATNLPARYYRIRVLVP